MEHALSVDVTLLVANFGVAEHTVVEQLPAVTLRQLQLGGAGQAGQCLLVRKGSANVTPRSASHLNPSARWRVTAWASNTSCNRQLAAIVVGVPQNSNPSYAAVEVGCWQSHTAILVAWRS